MDEDPRIETGIAGERRPEPGSGGDGLRFLRGFLRRPMTVASVVPSSRFLAARVARAALRGDARYVVELGPGTGAVTRALLELLPRDGRLVAVDVEPEFTERLRREPDPRLVAHCGDAGEIPAIVAAHRLPRVDAIVSGIPFSTIGATAGRRILEAAWRALAPGGAFVAYQFRPHVARLATPLFGSPDSVFEPRNVPPMTVYAWRRPRPS